MTPKKALSEEVKSTMGNTSEEELNWGEPVPSFQLAMEGEETRAITSLSWVMPPSALAPYTKIRWDAAAQTYSLYVAVCLMSAPYHTEPEWRGWRAYLPTCDPQSLHITLARKLEINNTMRRGRELATSIAQQVTTVIEEMSEYTYTLEVRSTDNLRVMDIHGGTLRTALLHQQRIIGQLVYNTASLTELECLWLPRLHFSW